jgi:hypothetical protein
VLLGSGPAHVRLVPDRLRRAGSEQAERNRVAALVGWLARTGHGAASAAAGGAQATTAAVAWARDGTVSTARVAVGMARAEIDARIEQLRLIAHYAPTLLVPDVVDQAIVRMRASAEWAREQATCTPPPTPPPRLAERHLVVEVAGLGSHQAKHEQDRSNGGSVFEVDTRAVGWADADVRRFSYRGGTTSQRGYTSADTQVDIRTSGRRLRELLERLQYEQPGVPIDIVAHSQGGLVVRSALGAELDRLDPRTPHIASVTTLATPHHGANMATAGALLSQTTVGDGVERVAGAARVGGIDPTSKSVRQLAETSSFIRELNRRPLPAGVHFTSIAGRGDPVVPSPRAHLDGATNVIVDVDGVGTDHARLPASPAATREIALAVSGRGPTCESLADAVGDAEYGRVISRTEDTVAVGSALLAAPAGVAVPVPHAIERTDP